MFEKFMDLSMLLDYLKANYEVANALAALSGTAIAFFAFCISLISLFFTWNSVRSQQKHNALSVRPFPYITVGDYQDLIHVKIRNNGTGPLIINKLEVIGSANPIAPLVESMPKLDHGISWSHFSGPLEGRSIPASGELVIVELKGDHRNQNFVKSSTSVRNALGKLALRLDYTDIYGSKLPVAERDLKWFLRTISNQEGK